MNWAREGEGKAVQGTLEEIKRVRSSRKRGLKD